MLDKWSEILFAVPKLSANTKVTIPMDIFCWLAWICVSWMLGKSTTYSQNGGVFHGDLGKLV